MSSEVLAAVNIKITIFRDAMLCSFVERYQCFAETCCLHLQGLSYLF
jgi:hypothetical protein